MILCFQLCGSSLGKSPDLIFENLWDELERRLRASTNLPTSVPDLSNALVAKWKQVPASMFQYLVESLPRRVDAIIAEKGGTNSILMLMILEWDFQQGCPHTYGNVVYLITVFIGLSVWAQKCYRIIRPFSCYFSCCLLIFYFPLFLMFVCNRCEMAS